jgi:hypothetical protein
MTNSATVNLTDYFLTDKDLNWKNIKITEDDWLDLHCADSVDLDSPPDLLQHYLKDLSAFDENVVWPAL